jgi:hypothetical protein
MSNTVHDNFWYEDINILFHPKRLTEFFPKETMNMTEKLNSIARFSIILGIVLYVYNLNLISMYIPFAGLIVTKILYEHHMKKENTENFLNGEIDDNIEKRLEDEKNRIVLENNKECVKPTNNNPFMNLKYTDHTEENLRPEACNVESEKTKDGMENNFKNNLFRDVSDVFGRNNQSRQFYTTANTSIPNKQDEFAKWLYGDMPSCKDASTTWKCVRHEDLRQNRKPVELNVNDFEYDLNKEPSRGLPNMKDKSD